MKIQAQCHPDLIRLSQLVEHIPVAMLTSSDGRGGMASRPMTPVAMDERGTFWFFTDVRSAKVDHLRMLNLSFSDAVHSVYVSLSGHGEIDADRSRIDLLWSLPLLGWFPPGRSPNLVLLKFLPHAAECWDLSGSRTLQMVASVAASMLLGRPPARLEEHHALQGFTAPAEKTACEDACLV